MRFIRKFFSVFLCLLVVIGQTPLSSRAEEETPVTTGGIWPSGPELSCGGAVLIEAGTGAVLYEKNATERLYPASTTKLMTTLLALENTALGETVVISHNAVYDIDTDSSRLWVDEGEELSMENSLYAVMLPSANDLAYAIGEHISGSKEAFAAKMNSRAAELGCVNSHFMNPHGLDEDGHYSCPYDLALIMRELVKFPTFLKISGSKNHEVPATNLCKESRWILNTHLMIRGTYAYDGVLAGKTGHTDLAGANLVTYAKRGNLALISVIMKAPDDDKMYDDTAALLNYGFNNFTTVNVDNDFSATDGAPRLFGKDDSVQHLGADMPISTDLSYIVLPLSGNVADTTREVSLQQITSFSHGRNVIGKVIYSYNGRVVGRSDIFYNNPEDAFTIKDSSEMSTPGSDSSPTDSEAPSVDRRPVVFGIIIGCVCFFIGSYLVFVEIPYRRKKAQKRR